MPGLEADGLLDQVGKARMNPRGSSLRLEGRTCFAGRKSYAQRDEAD
jgi:hypothetical protein